MFVRIDGVQAGEDHRLDIFKAGQGGGCRTSIFCYSIADLCISHVFYGRDEEADFAGGEFADLNRLGSEDAEGFNVKGLAVRHEADLHALAQAAVDDAGEHDDAAIGIKPRIEDQRLQWRVDQSLRRGQAFDDCFKDALDVQAGLRAHSDGVGSIEADSAFNHLLRARDVSARQINLVDDGDDLETVVDGEEGIGQGLGFDALRCIDHEQRAFAGGEGA